MSVQVSCPGCGAAIEFKAGSSVVAICPYCRSAVARGDRSVENLGKVADLVETESPLAVGLTGRYEGQPFTLTGRAQISHAAGGVWDEWYASFPNNRWGWLAEAQGKFYLTFEKPLPDDASLPPYEDLTAGHTIRLPNGTSLAVAEKGVARTMGAEGEIPYRLTPGQRVCFADLSGLLGDFATIDYSDERPAWYAGKVVTLDTLGIPLSARRHAFDVKQVEGVHLSCPNCGGALDLRAPDKAMRVGCPNCGALLDVKEGQLEILQALQPQKVEPFVPLGSVGTINGIKWTLLGMLVRSVRFDKEYFWREYLLYEPRHGFRWLVCSDDHWSFVEPVAVGDVDDRDTKASYDGRKFRVFQKADASVAYVIGEFYWKVQVGECVATADYIAPPYFLSKEVSTPGLGSEINWSLGTYMTPAEVEKAFDTKELPQPTTVAPNQPFPYKGLYPWWGVALAAGLVCGLLVLFTAHTRRVYEHTFNVPAQQSAEALQSFFSEPITLQGHKNLRIQASAPVNNTWVFIEGDLINEETGLVQTFDIPVEFYQGVEGGESWSEGSQQGEIYVSAVPAGTYTLRIEVQREHPTTPTTITLHIDQGVPRVLYWFLMMGVLSLVPLCLWIYHVIFDIRRWADSDFSPYQTSSE